MAETVTLADRVLAMARRLPSRDFEMLNLYFGIDGEKYSVPEIARIFKITRARARQRIDRVIERSVTRLRLTMPEESIPDCDLADLFVAGRMREREREEKPHA
jgi:DNA-directed RNA polymerase sigma subunit (sigma70/sigma32)